MLILTAREGAGGAGLGLAICRSIVDAHNGEIDVLSDPSGTVVSVRLPRSTAR